MRKQKSSSKQVPIQLSANKKSHSINLKYQQEPLFSPYKIEWKNSANDGNLYNTNQSSVIKQPLRNIQNNTTSNSLSSTNGNNKLFYQNMKNQLLNIKQDVEKMIMKEKKEKGTSQAQTSIGGSDTYNSTRDMSNGFVKTISIRNKCQQKVNRVQSLYQNTDKALTNKSNGSYLTYHKFTTGQSKLQSSQNNQMVEDQLKNSANLQIKYKTQKQGYTRIKSKSIADVFCKGVQTNKTNFVTTPPNRLQIKENQIIQEQNAQAKHQVKPKIEVDIKLPFFERQKTFLQRQQQKTFLQRQKSQQKRSQQEKQTLVHKLQMQLTELQKQIPVKDELISRKEECNLKLLEQIQQLKEELRQDKGKHEKQVLSLEQSSDANQHRVKELQMQLKNVQVFMQQKKKQGSYLQQKLNHQTSNIQFQASLIHQLKLKVQQLQADQQHSQNNNSSSLQQLSEQNKKLKEKLKPKENQLYIYQQQLKQAKQRIRQLKQQITEQGQKQVAEVELKGKSQTQQKYDQVLQINQVLRGQNQQIKRQFDMIVKINKNNEDSIHQTFIQNTQLKQKMSRLQKESQKTFEQTMHNPGFQNIGEQISKKLSDMVDENYSLKNKITHLQSDLQQTKLRNKSLTQQVKIYENKQTSQPECGIRLRIQDWDNLTQQRDNLQTQVDTVKGRLQQTKQFYQLQTMRKQNQIHELKQQVQTILESNTSQEDDSKTHPNIRSIRHIKNLDTLLNQFRDMIEYNLQMKEQLEKLRK